MELLHNEVRCGSEPCPRCVDWMQTLHAQIKTGGVWMVPRSGLTFLRTPEGFALQNVAPYMDPLHDDKKHVDAWRKHQIQDFKCLQRAFGVAGLDVFDPAQLLEGRPANAA